MGQIYEKLPLNAVLQKGDEWLRCSLGPGDLHGGWSAVHESSRGMKCENVSEVFLSFRRPVKD